VLAELALADAQFARGGYQEAIDSYKTFARLHPTHERVEDGYVAYKI
jgi:outer membrane protein assembly factor BamD (BamD/ComL family)